MESILEILIRLLNVGFFILIAHIIMSWLINFQVLNLRQPIVAQLWFGLNKLLEPLYGRVRRFLPDLGGIDLAPLIVLLVLFAFRDIIIPNFAESMGISLRN